MSTRIVSRNNNINISVNKEQGIEELIQAARNDDDAGLQQLLHTGVPVDGRNKNCNTALIYASLSGSSKCLQILINNGADVNANAFLSRTGLHWAVLNGHIDCARMLIAYGARIDERNIRGRTPLIYAADSGDNESVSCMRLLLDNNADAFAKANNGMTALDYAKKGDKGEMVKILEEHIAKINANKDTSESQSAPSAKPVDDNTASQVKTKQNRCTKCSCKECIQEKNEMLNKQHESEEEIRRIKEEITGLKIHKNHPSNISIFVAPVTTAMYGQDFLNQDALRTFSPGNRTKFIDNIKITPVLTHMYTAGAINETQLQRIESEKTNIDKANHLWNLMTTQQRYLDGVREALKSTGQNQLAGILI